MSYFGENIDLDACEALLHTRWTLKDRKLEPKLFASKWFDHRAQHPVQATYLFGHLFTQETRRIIRAHLDNRPPRVLASGEVIDWEPIKRGDYFMPPSDPKRHTFWKRKINSLIRARQSADQAGIPYDVYVRLGLKQWYWGRSYFMDYQALPEPGLLNGDECFNKILTGWMEMVQGSIQYAKSPRFQLSQGVKHPDVIEHQVWLLDQMARKADPSYAVRKFVGMDLLAPEAAVARFGSIRDLKVPVKAE